MKSRFSILILSFTCFLTSLAYVENLTFENYNIADGLSQSTVYSIYEDQRGIMWFGTYEGGLNSFDGYSFTWYQKNINDSTTIGGNNILTIEDFGNQRIVVTTNGTISTLNLLSDSISNFFYNPNSNPLLERSLHTVPYADNNVFVGHSSGLDMINLMTNEIKVILRGMSILDLHLSNNNELWIGTTKGLYLYSINSKSLLPYGPSNLAVNFVFVDSRQHIWFASNGKGMFKIKDKNDGDITNYRYNPSNKNSLSNNSIRCIIEDRSGFLWIGTGNGLNFFDIELEIFTRFYKNENNRNSLSQNSIYSLFKDSKNRLWVGTWNGGVNVIHFQEQVVKQFKHIPNNVTSLSNNLVSSFIESNNQLWIGTEKGGLNRFNPTNNTFTQITDHSFLPNSHIHFMEKDEYDNLWIGTNFTGLYYFNTQTLAFSHYMNGHSITSFARVNKNEYLVCTEQGLYLFDRRQPQNLLELLKLEEDPHYYSRLCKVKKRKSGQVILITSQGVYSYVHETKSLELYAQWEMPYNYRIDNVTEDSNENIWIGNDNGLFLLDDQNKVVKSHNLETASTLNIKSIIEGNNNQLWLSTNTGIYRYSYEKKHLVEFSNILGLKHQEFIKQASYKSSDNKLYFGAINGFIVFNPDRIAYDFSEYPIVFRHFEVLNRKAKTIENSASIMKLISQNEEINLSYYQNTITIKYAALNYIKSKNTEYAYLLKNYDNKWNYVGGQRSARFTHLPPGRYDFMVKCTNRAGEWSNSFYVVRINIHPPFWKTVWFRIVFTVTILLIIFLVFRMRINVVRRRNIVLQKEVKLQTREILQQKEELEAMSERIQESTQAKLRFYTNISHELRTPLTLIMGPVEELIENSRERFTRMEIDMLTVIRKNSIRLMQLINSLMDFRKIEQNKMKLNPVNTDLVAFSKNIKSLFDKLAAHQNIEFIIHAEHNSLLAPLDLQKMEIVYFNLLSNAFKFTPEGGRIEICIKVKNRTDPNNLHTLQIDFKDTGCGIEKDQLSLIFDRFMQVNTYETQKNYGSGIGLALTKEIVQLHKGTLTVISEIDKGSTFSINIPYNPFDQQNIIVDHSQLLHSISNTHIETINNLETSLLADKLTKLGKAVTHKPVGNNKSTILLVDDNFDIRKHLRTGLANSYNIFEADNGVEAMDIANAIIPDLIISDYMMPQMNGFDLCSALKLNITTSHIPIILLTAYSTDDNHIKGLNIGADDYISKPFKMGVLKARVANILTSRNELKKKFSSEVNFNSGINSYTKVDQDFLNNVIGLIEQNIDDPEFNVEKVSSMIGYSSAHFLRKIQSLTNLKANEFIRNIRLKKAARLLSETELQVQEVMYLTGFDSRSAFNHNFKKHLSITPSAYIKKFRKQ